MFDTINGIPLHPLVVHGVVVLLPLAILGTIAIALRPSWRRPYGLLVVAAAAAATALTPIATSSGEELEGRVGSPGEHAEIGEQLLWFELALLVLVAALIYLDRRTTAEPEAPTSASSTPIKVLTVLTVIAAVAAGVQVYRVGDSGAKAAWCARVQTCTADSGSSD